MTSSWTFEALTLHLHDEHPDAGDGKFEWQSILSPAERERATGMIDARARTFLSARAYLRQHIAAMTGSDAATLEIELDPHGKPYLVWPDAAVSFSLSHSEGKILIGLVRGKRPVGVDLQYMDPDTDIERIAARFFTPDERAELAAAPNTRIKGFEIWCRKEALFKLGTDTPPQHMHIQQLDGGFMLAACY